MLINHFTRSKGLLYDIMVLSDNDIISKFSINMLSNITVETDYDNVKEMIQSIYGISDTLIKTLRYRVHGHIGLIMIPNMYTMLSPKPHISMPYPGVSATVTVNNVAVYRQKNCTTIKITPYL